MLTRTQITQRIEEINRRCESTVNTLEIQALQMESTILQWVLSDQVKLLSNDDIILKTVAEYYNTTPRLMLLHRHSSKREHNEPRSVCFYLCCKLTNMTLTQIGSRFGKDHASISHARNVIAGYLETNSELRIRVHNIEQTIKDQLL